MCCFGAAAIGIGAGLVCRVHYTAGFGPVLCEIKRETGHEFNVRVKVKWRKEIWLEISTLQKYLDLS